MRKWNWCVLALPLVAGCAPGQPLDNVTAFSTEDTGSWNVIERSEQDGRIRLRIVADRAEAAETIARKVIDQQLDRSPSVVIAEVVSRDARSGPPIARVTWERPAGIPAASLPPDSHGTSAGDHQGSPGATVRLPDDAKR